MSVTFDPFMYLTLPLPSTTMRTMTLTVLSTDGSTLPAPFTVTVPKCGRFKDLTDALSSACSLKSNETFLVAEVCCSYVHLFIHFPLHELGEELLQKVNNNQGFKIICDKIHHMQNTDKD